MGSEWAVKMKFLFLLSPFLFFQLLPAQSRSEKIPGVSISGTFNRFDTLQEKQTKYLQGLYESVLHLSSNEILNGREYDLYFFLKITNPLIPTKPYPLGSIIIRGKNFNKVMLQYDTFKDLVVYYDPLNLINNAIVPIVINRHIINEFNLVASGDSMKFKYLEASDNLKEKFPGGFYEIGYDGNCRFIIKHRSIIVIREGRQIYKYMPLRYFVNNGNYYKIKGRRSLLKVLSDKRSEVKKFIRSSTIPVRFAKKEEMVRIAKFYDSLKQPNN